MELVFEHGVGAGPFKKGETPQVWGACITAKYEYVVGVFNRNEKRQVVVVGYRERHSLKPYTPTLSTNIEQVHEALRRHCDGAGGIPATESEARWYLSLAPVCCATLKEYEAARAREAERKLQQEVHEPEDEYTFGAHVSVR